MPARSGGRNRFKKTVFSNGLTLISERHSQYRSLSIGIWVKVGTRHELPSEAGASHFLEHMLFKGTDNRSALDIAKEVDQVGGDFNAFTAREYTCFHILLLDRDAALGLDILSDIVLNSNFDAEELERERKVILQEISMVEDSHEELAHDLYFELLYGKHGLGKPILGTETSIRRMRRADLLRFFRNHYRPDKLIVSVAGNVSHETLKKRLKPLTRTSWPGRANGKGRKKRRAHPTEPAPKLKHGHWWVERRAEQAHLIWGVEGPKYGSRDRYAAFLLNVYLGGGMSSTLFQEIREKKGLAYTVYSSLSPFLDSGVFSIYVGTSIQHVPICLKLIEECIVKLKRDLLTDEELETTKENLKGTILLNADGVESRMSSIATNEIFFREYVGLPEICERIDEVTPADLRRVARKILHSEKASVLALGPRPTKSVRQKLHAWSRAPWKKLRR
jgi:predicted Zn-dependent peptidase